MNNIIMSKFTTLNHYYVQRTAVLQNIIFPRFLLQHEWYVQCIKKIFKVVCPIYYKEFKVLSV